MRLLFPIFFVLSSCANAQRPGFSIPPWTHGRFFHAYSDHPILEILEKNHAFMRSARLLLAHVHHVELAIHAAVLLNATNQLPVRFSPCAVDDRRFAAGLTHSFGIKGWPPPDTSCVTDFFAGQTSDDDRPVYTAERVREALLESSSAQREEHPALVRRILRASAPHPILRDWTAFRLNSRRRSRPQGGFSKCRILNTAAVRLGDKWYLQVLLTNWNTSASARARRQVLSEFVHVDPHGASHAARARLPVDGPVRTGARTRNGTTTILSLWEDEPPSPSSFFQLHDSENPAVRAALEQARRSAAEHADALSVSGLFSLFGPAALTLLPVAALVQPGGMLSKVSPLATNIVAIMPLAIKAGELIAGSVREHFAVVTRMATSATGRRGEAGGADMWAVSCQDSSSRTTGVVFAAIAVVLVVGSVLVQASMVQCKRRKLNMCSSEEEATRL